MSLLLRTLPLSLPVFRSFILKPFPKTTLTLFSVSHASTTGSSETHDIPNPKPRQPLNRNNNSNSNSLQWVTRTSFCGHLSTEDLGKRVRLCGWVALHRVHGSLTFLNLRDHTGLFQVTTLPDEFSEAHSTINDLRLEYVIAVEGVVRPRPSDSVNQKMKTGFIEVAAEHVQVLNAVKSKLPFLVTTADDAKDFVKEEIRLR